MNISSCSSISGIYPKALELLHEKWKETSNPVFKVALSLALIVYSFFKEIVAACYFTYEKVARSLLHLHSAHRVINKNWLIFKPDTSQKAVQGHVILIHGYLHDEGCWTEWVQDLLAAGMMVYVPRMDKFHRHHAHDYTAKIRQLIEHDIENQMEQGCLPKAPLHLVGHSMGGLISCDLARQKPHSFATLSSIGAPLHGALALARLAALVHPCVHSMLQGHSYAKAICSELSQSSAQMQFFTGELDIVVPKESALYLEKPLANIVVKYCGHMHLVCDANTRERVMRQIKEYSTSV